METSTLILLVLNGLLALAAIASSTLTYWLLRRQMDPEVIVYATDLDHSRTLLFLVIENIGAGPAFDIKFESSRPIPGNAWGIGPNPKDEATEISDGPLVEGIPYLNPGGRRIFHWGQFGGLTKALGASTIRVTATYEARHRLFWDSDRISSTSTLDIHSFRGAAVPPTPATEELAKSFEKFRRAFESKGRPHTPIEVRVADTESE